MTTDRGITLDEAIKILDINQAPPLMHPESKYNYALQLGIEALKRVSDQRRAAECLHFQPLPGETKG